MNSRWTGLKLDPLDTLFFRDGRPFDPTNRVSGGLPNPQTLAGAIRTAMLVDSGYSARDFRKFATNRRNNQDARTALGDRAIRNHFRGPWLAWHYDDGRVEPLLCVPHNVVREETDDGVEWHRSHPLANVPGWIDTQRLPLWRHEALDAKPTAGFLTLEGIAAFLNGGVPHDSQWYRSEDLYDYDNRTGIVIDPQTFSTQKGRIYGIRLLSLNTHAKPRTGAKAKLGLYAEITADPNAPQWKARTIPFGGEGKYVRADTVTAVTWPTTSHPTSHTGRSVRYLATPAFVGDGLDHPDGLTHLTVRAAASDHPLPISGWDVARNGPNRLRFAVPAGSVYFTESADELAHGSACTDLEDVAQGWGFTLTGAWKDED